MAEAIAKGNLHRPHCVAGENHARRFSDQTRRMLGARNWSDRSIIWRFAFAARRKATRSPATERETCVGIDDGWPAAVAGITPGLSVVLMRGFPVESSANSALNPHKFYIRSDLRLTSGTKNN